MVNITGFGDIASIIHNLMSRPATAATTITIGSGSFLNLNKTSTATTVMRRMRKIFILPVHTVVFFEHRQLA
jgi:hypothetical protein